MGYIIALLIFAAVYILVISLMKHMSRTKIANAVFAAISVICYISLVVTIYKDVGPNDWNFRNALPTANVSPFMFASLIIYLFLPEKAKKYWSVLISLLSLGMLLSVGITCVSRARIHYKFHFHFLWDYIAHLSLSLFGVYLVRSKQVQLNKKNCFVGGSLIVITALVMLVINVIFNTSFFGLSLNDDYNIYNMVLAPNCYLSALLYFGGLLLVLLAGRVYVSFFENKKKSKKEME